MKILVLVIALYGVTISAQAPCTTTTCLINCPLDARCPPFNTIKAVLLPHTSCSRFLKCHNGRACPYECPAGLHFNRVKMACDWPQQACCDPTVPCIPDPCNPITGCPPPRPPTPGPCPPTICRPPTTTPAPCPPTVCPRPPTTTPAPCPPILCPTPPPPCSGGGNNCDNCDPHPECPLFNPPKPKLLRHRNCTRYYKCETGRACEMVCPPGLHFNVAKQVCDWPWFACCDPTIQCRPNPCDTNECPPTNLPPTCIAGWNC